MVPAAFVSLAIIPLNPSGKVDRRALARMDVAIVSGQDYVSPRNDTERQLVAIWAEVLKLAPEKIGVHDNFFELGGPSLLATQLIAKIRSRLNIDLPLKALFERTTVARFAELIVKPEESRQSLLATQLIAKLRDRLEIDSPLRALFERTTVDQLAELIAEAEKGDTSTIRPVDRGELERLPLSFAQERLWFVNELEPDSAGYNIPRAVAIRGELDIRYLEEAFNRIIERHETLRTVFPSHEGQARQQILDHLDFKLERIDLRHCETREARNSKAQEICQTDAAMPFDLARGPLIRGKVMRLAEH